MAWLSEMVQPPRDFCFPFSVIFNSQKNVLSSRPWRRNLSLSRAEELPVVQLRMGSGRLRGVVGVPLRKRAPTPQFPTDCWAGAPVPCGGDRLPPHLDP